MYDMIIVGGGPSGLTAALYAGRAELKALMIEKAFHGGQMVTTNEVENYPGIMETTGPELAGIMYEQAIRFGTEVKFEEVIKIEDEGDVKKVVTASNMYEAKTILLSMGAKPRKLGLPNEEALAGKGVSYCAICVYGIASIGAGGITPIKLALAGSAVSAILSSLVSLIILPRADVMDAYRFWQVGSLSGATWESIKAVLPFLIVGFVISIVSTPALNALSLGDELATGLGVNTGLVRILCAIAGVILCGATTAIAGPIGFVGLMIPHTIRLIFGSDMKNLIPMSAIGGAIILTISDVIGRIIGSPSELEVGIITAFLGAPILIMIARKAKVKSI